MIKTNFFLNFQIKRRTKCIFLLEKKKNSKIFNFKRALIHDEGKAITNNQILEEKKEKKLK